METAMIQFSSDQPANNSPYKQIRAPRTISRSLISPRSSERNIHGGPLLTPPPSLYFSCPSSASVLFNQAIHQYYQTNNLQPQQPPLLPLPINKPYHSLPSRISRVDSSPLPLTKRKSKSAQKKPKSVKREDSKSAVSKSDYEKSKLVRDQAKSEYSEDLKLITEAETDGGSVISSGKPSGPEPDELPRDVSRVLQSSPTKKSGVDSVFTLSPPPSSLPLPKFPLRRNLGSDMKVAGIDAGATDGLRRMLRMV